MSIPFLGLMLYLWGVIKMTIYDNDGKRKLLGVRLTLFQLSKLKHICELFGFTQNIMIGLMIDGFYMEYLEIISGRIDSIKATQQSMLKLIDELIKLRELKGLTPPPYHLRQSTPAR